MWAWILGLMGKIGAFLKPLVSILASKTGVLLCEAASAAVMQVAVSDSTLSWSDKLQTGVEKATAELETKGLKLGVDFFLNDLIGAITAAIAKNYTEK